MLITSRESIDKVFLDFIMSFVYKNTKVSNRRIFLFTNIMISNKFSSFILADDDDDLMMDDDPMDDEEADDDKEDDEDDAADEEFGTKEEE